MGRCKKLKIHGNTAHGHRPRNGKTSPTYESWRGMIARCEAKNHKNYALYCNRKICKRWFQFKNFLMDMGERPLGTTIDRIDNNKGYSKSNCRWATQHEQHRNHSRNILVTIKGKTQCLKDWAKDLNLSYDLVMRRRHIQKLSILECLK